MPSELEPLHGDSFTQFLRDSAANSRRWPQWVRGDEQPSVPSSQGREQEHETDSAPENSQPANNGESR